MAKKSASKPEEAPAKAATKKEAAAAPKKADVSEAKAAPKKGAKKVEAPAPVVEAKPAPKKGGKKAAAPVAEVAAPAPAPAPKAEPKKAAGAVRMTPTQTEFLKKIGDAGEEGYLIQKKIELRTIDALKERKFVKQGAKDKTSGGHKFLLTAAGKKFLAQTPQG